MSDFRLKVQAQLDAKELDRQINEYKNKEIPLKFKAEGLKNLDKKTLSYIEKLESKNIDFKFNVTGIDDLNKAVNTLKDISSGKGKKINIEIGGSKSVEKDISNYKLLKNLADELSRKKISLSGLDASKDGNKISELKKQINSLQAEYDTLFQSSKSKLSENQLTSLTQTFSKMDNAISETKAKMLDMANAPKKVAKEVNQLDVSTFINRIGKTIETNTKLTDAWVQKLQELQLKAAKVTNTDEFSGVKKQYSNFMSEISKEGLLGKSFRDNFKQSFGRIFQFSGIYAAIQNGIFEIPRQVITAVKDVNAAQIELAKVSSASSSQLSNYWDQAADSAKKYGSTISDVISSTADWSRLGYNLEQAKQLSDMTTLLQRVGDNMTQETSSQGLISTLRGFELDASSAQKIVDVANEIANTQPIDTSGIFEAMQRSASSLKAAGNTFEQGVSLATAANSVVQDSQKIGTALKTISMRIRGASTQMQEEGLDVEGMATSTSKLRAEIKALSGVDIMKNANEFKSTYDILDELSKKWSELTDIQQASVTELIAGGQNLARIYRNINKRTYLIARAT